MKIFEHYFNTFIKLLDTFFLSKNAISPVHLDDFRAPGLVTMVGWDIQNPHDLEATFTLMPERGRCETFAIFWFLFFNINHQYLTLLYILISQWISSRWACSNLLLMSSLHQIGLAIGLNPSRVRQSVMFPLYRSDLPVKSLTLYEGTLILMIFFCSHTAPRVELGGDDTVGLQKIYGPKKKPTSTEIWV